MTTMTIGQVSKETGVKVPTIRFYEGIGLVPPPDRTISDRRIYTPSAVQRLRFIRHARDLGFPVEAIRTLLDLAANPERACGDANLLAAEQLQSVEAKIAQLEALRHELRRMVDAGCDGPASDCRVIETLANHELCLEDHTFSQSTVHR